MRPPAEAFYAVVGAHARIADAAEGQVVVAELPAPVADRHAARANARQQLVQLRGDAHVLGDAGHPMQRNAPARPLSTQAVILVPSAVAVAPARLRV